MTALSFLMLRRSVDALLGFLLIDLFGPSGSLTGAWSVFCDLPDLSKIGAITVLVIIGSVLVETGRALVAAFKRWIGRRGRQGRSRPASSGSAKD